MAQRRMFSKDITSSDAFLDMPTSTQALYFQLGMHADDDGFLGGAKRIARMLGCSEDDFKILVAKRFVLVFDNGICVIKHRKMNNQIRKDRYKKTVYMKELSSLKVKENGAYTEMTTNGLPNGNQMETQYSIVEDSIVEDIEEEKKPVQKIEDFIEVRNKCIIKTPNSKQLPKTKKVTKDLKSIWLNRMKEYTYEEILEGLRNYLVDCAERKPILDDPKHYNNHRFTAYEFLKRTGGLQKFFNS